MLYFYAMITSHLQIRVIFFSNRRDFSLKPHRKECVAVQLGLKQLKKTKYSQECLCTVLIFSVSAFIRT